jgi:hypothetical protein
MVERLHPEEPPKEILNTRHYRASSIIDMLDSRDEMVHEITSEHQAWKNGLSRWGKLEHAYNQLQNPIIRTVFPEVFWRYPTAFVLIPPVRHFPQDDPPEGKGKVITIQDMTGSCDVEIPWGENARRVVRNDSLKNHPELYAENAWSGVVAILNAYDTPRGDRSVLAYVDRIIHEEKDKSKAFNKMLEAFGQGSN